MEALYIIYKNIIYFLLSFTSAQLSKDKKNMKTVKNTLSFRYFKRKCRILYPNVGIFSYIPRQFIFLKKAMLAILSRLEN